MTVLGKIILVVILLLVATNAFLFFEIHKLNGSLASMRSSINQLDKKTSQNQHDINGLQNDVFHIYAGP